MTPWARTIVAAMPRLLAMSFATMNATRETGFDNTQAAVPARFSPMTASCMTMVTPMGPANPMKMLKIMIASEDGALPRIPSEANR